MKYPLLLLSLFLTLSSIAQDKQTNAVVAATEKLRVAMIDGNKEQLEKLVADQLSYGHSSGHIDHKTEFLDKLVSGKSDFLTIELKEQSVSVSGKTAIVRHKLNATTNDGGKQGEVHLAVMLVWQKKHGRWILLGRQAIKAT